MKTIEEFKTGSLFAVLRENTETGFFEVWTGDDTIDHGTDDQLGDLIAFGYEPICEAQIIFNEQVDKIRALNTIGSGEIHKEKNVRFVCDNPLDLEGIKK